MKRCIVFLAILTILCVQSGRADASYKVLFLGYDINVGGTFTDILGTDPRFDLANSSFQSSGLPTLATLQQYDSVLVWTNIGPPNGLGDLLADYADSGGGVVLATFNGYYSSFGGFPGRINSPGYNPFTGGTTNAYNNLTLGTYNPADPLMAGVTSLSSVQYNGDWMGVDPGARLAASWSNGRPLAGVSASGRVANIALFPNVATYGHATGDYRQLFLNALAETANPSNQAVVTPEPASMTMMGIGLLSLAGYGVRRRNRTTPAA